MCSWHKQLPHVTGIGPQWATTSVRSSVRRTDLRRRGRVRFVEERPDLGLDAAPAARLVQHAVVVVQAELLEQLFLGRLIGVEVQPVESR